MALNEHVLLTRKGFEQKQKRLEECLQLLHYVIPERLKQAIQHSSDLNDNSEYWDAEMQKEWLEVEVQRLETLLYNAKIIDGESISTDQVELGVRVILKDTANKNKVIVFELVTPAEVDLEHGRVSTESPLGKLLLGKHKNQQVKLKTLLGKTTYKIVEIQQCD